MGRKGKEKNQQQKELLTKVLESLVYPFYIIDAKNYNIVMANSAAGFGKLSKGSKCYKLTHKRNKPCSGEHYCPLEIVKKTKRHVMVEHVHYDQEGKVRHVEVYGDPVFDAEGNVSQMIEYVLDVTERKQNTEKLKANNQQLWANDRQLRVAGEELRLELANRKKVEKRLLRSQQGLKNVMQNIPGMIYRANPDWSMDLVYNSKLICGYSQEELRKKKIGWVDLIHPDDKERVLKESLRIREGHSAMVQEYRIISKSKGVRWVSDQKTSYFSEDNTFQGINGIVYDVTKRKKTEISLQKSRERYKTLFESSRDAIMVVSPNDYRFRSANKTALEVFGCSLPEFISKTPVDFSPKRQPDNILSAKKAKRVISIALEKGSNFFEWKHKRFDGREFYASVLLTPFRWDDEFLIQATVRDITKRKEAEHEMRKTKKNSA